MITVDARGDKCPVPVVKTMKVLKEMTSPDTVQVLVDNEAAVQNVERLAKNSGFAVASAEKEKGTYEILITVSSVSAGTQIPQDAVCCGDADGGFIVVVSSAFMGSGNDELGKVLMKGFLYAVSQLETLPEKILFYNGGVTLTTEGSASLEDLKNMEAQGVEIFSCGTCLDYYNLKDKLAVGGVTNMYAIVEAMQKAGKIVRP